MGVVVMIAAAAEAGERGGCGGCGFVVGGREVLDELAECRDDFGHGGVLSELLW